ncbi:hypothetical protein CSW58_05905 [Caulobacter sp. B11]|uniref:hypothetical protein n=1 Tax=Caulobacter sp. B11 TaxID=2048899 RepID=UPI000C12C8F5|nr:hypothetical protein [Caulobacter sp. B11]PHY13420.1 hypothetical protein CSW58_05905 [Caulobacter sp. B11]
MNDFTKSRAAERASASFVLAWAEAARLFDDVDLIDLFIFTTTLMSNVGAVRMDEFQGFEVAPPDERRRPVGVAQVASSLDMPYETVRRRMVRLAASKYFERVSHDGYIVSHSAMMRPEMQAILIKRHVALQRFLRELNQAGVVED